MWSNVTQNPIINLALVEPPCHFRFDDDGITFEDEWTQNWVEGTHTVSLIQSRINLWRHKRQTGERSAHVEVD